MKEICVVHRGNDDVITLFKRNHNDSESVVFTFCRTTSEKTCDCQLIFFSILLFSPHRKTLQLNWKGAEEGPLFPQADFSGNYSSFVAFAGPFGISQHAHSHLDTALLS